MQAEGLKSIFPQSDLALFGLFELLPKIPLVLRRLKETADVVKILRPAAVVTIDGPDFSFRLAKMLQGTGIPLIHDVAPSVWAWREGRAKKIAKLYTHLLALLPFEPKYFTKEKLPTTFTGHPVVERIASEDDAAKLRAHLKIPADKKILCVLPGSRKSEIRRLAPIFGKTLGMMIETLKDAVVVLPTLPQVAEYLTPYLEEWPVPPVILLAERDKYAAFKASHAALAASGTVSLELAMANVPHIIAYKMNLLTVMLYRGFIKLKWFNLVNILLQREVVPELLQFDCTPEKLSEAMKKIWKDNAARDVQLKGFAEARAMLVADNLLPSQKAADVIVQVANVNA
jgi:lipid-A-disaccharide synthase